MDLLELCSLCKEYPGGVTAVDNLSLTIHKRDFVVFVGPSGCGKSTTLRMIAGLEEITRGELLLDGKCINHTPSKSRDMAMVFQNYALYPHMTVYNNMAFSLKLQKVSKQEIKERVEKTAEMLDIQEFLWRKPKALSGGQRQRVAMGRALIKGSGILLLDEPLSNLDAALRDQIRTQLAQLHKSLDTTFLYVTHDQTEAMTLGTRIVVMKDGLVQQVDTPEQIYTAPTNLFVAGFIGSPPMNFVEARIEKHQDTALLSFQDARIPLTREKSRFLLQNKQENAEVVLGIRPEDIAVLPEPTPHSLKASIQLTEMRGADSILHLIWNEISFTVRQKTDFHAPFQFHCHMVLPPKYIQIFSKDTGQRIL